MKNVRAFLRGWEKWRIPLLVLAAAACIFVGFTVRDSLILRRTLDETFAFMQQRIANCESYTANDEAKSLVHLLDKTTELSRVLAAEGEMDADTLQRYAASQRLSGVRVLNDQMQTDLSVDLDGGVDWSSFLQSDCLRDIADYPEKVYLSRLELEGCIYDVAVVARQDAPGVVFCCFHRSIEDDGDYAIENLFNDFTFDMSGIVLVSDGKIVVNSNLQSLQGLTMEECALLRGSRHTAQQGEILRSKGSHGIWYGSKMRVRSYDLYAFFPESQVYKTRTIVTTCSLIVMLLGWLVVLMLRGRTERETLAQSQKRLRIINAISTAYSAIMLVQLREKTVEVYKSSGGGYENYKSEMSHGSQAEQISRFVAPEYRQKLAEFSDITTMPQRLKGHDSLSYTWQTASDGWMTSLVVPQRYDENGALVAVLIANQDVTEEKQREQEVQRKLEKTADEARRANAAKTDFLRRMSHDIRTPINGIRGMVEISRHCVGDEEKQEECRQKIWDASGFLLELVNNVLDMNKLESGEIQLEEVPFDLCRLVHETNSVIEVQAGERGVTLHDTGVQAKHTKLIGSPVHLRQVFQNVESNAVKYTPEGGSVTVAYREVECRDDTITLEFTCSDTGIGMSEEFQKKAFEPFAQEDTTARTVYSGTGLGLAITHELVEQMGGTVTFESHRGAGTAFTIRLPLRIDTAAEAPQPAEKQAQPGSIQGTRVLLVEDNELNMEIAQFVLESAGAQVTKAWNGQEAVDAFAAAQNGSFDVILMDVMMPVMGGLEAARRIRAMKRPDAATVPIFAMTANAFQDDIERSRAAGMNEHLTKPLDTQKLLELIARYHR